MEPGREDPVEPRPRLSAASWLKEQRNLKTMEAGEELFPDQPLQLYCLVQMLGLLLLVVGAPTAQRRMRKGCQTKVKKRRTWC